MASKADNDAARARLVDEQQDNQERLQELRALVASESFGKLSYSNQILMETQVKVMEQYGSLLNSRLQLWSDL